MRILIVNQFFWPDFAPTGQYACDLAEYLRSEGNFVTVICSAGAYAKREYIEEDPPPVNVIRVPGFAYRRGALARLISYATFLGGALWHQLRVPKPDLILSMTTPPFLGVAGSIVKTIRGIRHYIWEMDVFPDALVTIGALSQRSVLTRVLGWIQDITRCHSDGIIVLGECMRNRLLKRGVPSNLLHVAENWADGDAISPEPIRRSGPLNIFYSGNFGVTHDIDTITAAMRYFRTDSRFVFTFAGGGVGHSQLQQRCATDGIENVRFLPYADRNEMSDHLAQADIGLVTERPECIGTVVPSKTYSLMAAGRPILFIGPRTATPGSIVERFRCGWQIDPGDVSRLIALLESLSASREVVREYGRRARSAFEKHYDLPLGVARVAAVLGVAAIPEVLAKQAAVAGFSRD